jgi:hypothetical protein
MESATFEANRDDAEYPSEDTLGDQALRGSAFELETVSTPLPVSGARRHALIERMAYEIFVARGRQPGHELDDWYAAEHMVLSEIAPDQPDDGDQSDGKIT